jgi:hypothetical protein
MELVEPEIILAYFSNATFLLDDTAQSYEGSLNHFEFVSQLFLSAR